MGLELNHAIVRCTDKAAASADFAMLIASDGAHQSGQFVAVPVNDRLTLDFYDEGPFVFGHFAFLAEPHEFHAILARAIAANLAYGSGPFDRDYAVNRMNGGLGVYVWDRDGNSYEFFTVDPLG